MLNGNPANEALLTFYIIVKGKPSRRNVPGRNGIKNIKKTKKTKRQQLSLDFSPYSLKIAVLNPHKHYRKYCQTVNNSLRLQALVYDIPPSRKVPESDARSAQQSCISEVIKKDSKSDKNIKHVTSPVEEDGVGGWVGVGRGRGGVDGDGG